MASKCFMCGAAISQGILCEKCDKPRRPKSEHRASPPSGSGHAPAPTRTPPPMPPVAAAAAPAALPEEFPKAPILQFPIESASPALTSLANVLIAAGSAAILLGPDRGVKFMTEEAKKLFGVPQSDLGTVKQIEALSGARIGELSVPASAAIRIRNRNIVFSLIPLSGGASGAVLVFREAEPMNASHASFVTFVRETVFMPLRSLHESMTAASRARQRDPLFEDAAATIDQILSSLEMAPQVRESPAVSALKVTEIVR